MLLYASRVIMECATNDSKDFWVTDIEMYLLFFFYFCKKVEILNSLAIFIQFSSDNNVYRKKKCYGYKNIIDVIIESKNCRAIF